MAKDVKLEKIGGWLLFFIITLIIISPLFNVLSGIFTSTSVLDVVLNSIDILPAISLSILAGIFLLKKKPYAVKFTKIFLITTLILNVVISLIFSDFGSIFSGSLYFVIWTLYLYKSKRVKHIYGNLKESNKGYQVWSILAIIYAFISPIYGLVFSIIALMNISKNRKLKGFSLSVIALVMSVIMILAFIGLILILGLIAYVPEDIDISCADFCYESDENYAYYSTEYDLENDVYDCTCVDEYYNVLDSTVFEYI